MLRRRRALGLTLILGSQLLLLALSLPVVANALARSLEPPPVTASRAEAGAGHRHSRRWAAIAVRPEWGGETVKTYTLQRLRYGARLARETGLPIYVSGGRPDGGRYAEGDLMRDVLVKDYHLDVRWVDIDGEDDRRERD